VGARGPAPQADAGQLCLREGLGEAVTWLRIFMVVCALVNLLVFAWLWGIKGDFNSTVLINSGLLLMNVYLSHLNDVAHDIIRQQAQIIRTQHMMITGEPLE
jgi:hypothetical protein